MFYRIRTSFSRGRALTVAALLALGTLWPTAPSAMAAAAASASVKTAADAYVLRVDGLACPYCAYGIEKQFSGMKGVTGTDVDIAKGVVVVHVKPGTRFTKQQIKKTVNDAGFTLKRIVSTPQQGQ